MSTQQTNSQQPDLEFDPDIMRALVAADPFIAYTQERRSKESEEQWLQRLFSQHVLPDPGLRYQYRAQAARRRPSA